MSIKLRLRSSLANNDHSLRHSDDQDSDSSENTQSENWSHEMEREKLKKLKNRLKKLGITNIDEHVKQVHLDEEKKSRKTRSNMKPSDLSQINGFIQVSSRNTNVAEADKDFSFTNKPTSTFKTVISKPDTSHTQQKRSTRNKLVFNHESTVSSLLMAAKSLNRKRSTDAESEDEQNMNKKKVSKHNSNERDSPKSQCESDDDDDHPMDNFCKVPGCDSNGHLSGEFPTHSISTTCPVFHNQTAEECVEKYKKRNDILARKESSSKLRKSPLKKNISLEKNSQLNCIMEERKSELAEISQKGDVMSMITSR